MRIAERIQNSKIDSRSDPTQPPLQLHAKSFRTMPAALSVPATAKKDAAALAAKFTDPGHRRHTGPRTALARDGVKVKADVLQ